MVVFSYLCLETSSGHKKQLVSKGPGGNKNKQTNNILYIYIYIYIYTGRCVTSRAGRAWRMVERWRGERGGWGESVEGGVAES